MANKNTRWSTGWITVFYWAVFPRTTAGADAVTFSNETNAHAGGRGRGRANMFWACHYCFPCILQVCCAHIKSSSDLHETQWVWTIVGPENHDGHFKVTRGQMCVIYAIFLTLLDLNETWWMWTIGGPEEHDGHFEVIGGQICIIYAISLTLTDLNETW